MKPFLTANWTHLINITYAVPPELLLPFLPKGTALDIIDGKAFVSIVPFDFTDAHLLGMKMPFHSDFPEINLRFYVTHNGNRGVVFLKEFVPKFFIGTIANLFYNEHYCISRMKSSVVKSEGSILVKHTLKRAGKEHTIEVKAGNTAFLPVRESMQHFFEERFYGYSSDRKGNTLQFRVEHESWKIFPVTEYKVDIDHVKVFGEEWSILNNMKPYCVMLLNGSAVKMFPHIPISVKQKAPLVTAEPSYAK